jgi:hypothetical protein
MKSVQATSLDAQPNGIARYPDSEQLPERHHTVLPLGQRSDLLIE